jgi:hypothetical protein
LGVKVTGGIESNSLFFQRDLALLDFTGQLDKSRYRVRSEAYVKAEAVPADIAIQFEGPGV